MKKKMVSLRFTSLLILALFFLLHAPGSSLAHAYHAYAREELADGICVEVTRRKDFGGRKLIIDRGLRGEAQPQMKHSSETASMLPGNYNDDALKKPLKKSSQNIPQTKVDFNKPEPETSNPKASKQAIQELNNADVKDRVERLLKATKEMVSLMHDYGFNKPKRKPPINNQGPRD